MRTSGRFVVLGLLLTCCAASIVLAQTVPRESVQGPLERTSRGNFRLPKLFDYERYKQLFKKSYRSLAEELAREKVYLANAFRVFVAAVSYKIRRTSSYLSVNEMSDWTKRERAALRMKGEGFLEQRREDDSDDDDRIDEEIDLRDEPEKSPKLAAFEKADIGAIEATLGKIQAKQGLEPGFRELTEELDRERVSGRRKRDTKVRYLSLDELAQPKVVPEEIYSVTPDRKPNDNDGELVPPEGLDIEPDSSRGLTSFGASPIDSLIDCVRDWFKPDDEPEPSDLPDEIFVDHRTHCMSRPRGQGMCGSCYAFSTMAVYEWHLCNATGIPVRLSEQYLVDCGPKHSWFFGGCDGGSVGWVDIFVKSYGLELRSKYPYRGIEGYCPYTPGEARKSTDVSIRVRDKGLKRTSLEKAHHYLEQAPLTINIHANELFDFYGGGVDDLRGCRSKDAHSMALVGSGREDGYEYWLMRNSYGPNWGEGGYYKLNKNAKKCISLIYRLKGFEFDGNSTELR